MTIKTIGLGLMSAAEAEWLVPQACDLARGFGAHLTAAHPVETIMPYSVLGAPYLSAVEPALFDWQIKETESIRARFDSGVRDEDFGAEIRTQAAGALDARTWLLDSLRAAELVVLGRNTEDAITSHGRAMQEMTIRDGGRPVLMLPKGRGLGKPASRLLIGWSSTREATRAAHDALRLAAAGATIDLLCVHDHGTPARLTMDSRQDLAAALDRHGFCVNLLDRDAPAGETGATLLRAAMETGADLVATGAYGHSRSYDFIIGAVTRHLVENADLPVLLSR